MNWVRHGSNTTFETKSSYCRVARQGLPCASMADGCSICSSDADALHVKETESSSLDPESCELEYLHLNDGKLVWMNDLESLKKFVENVLKLQEKWLTPGGNTKQFKCSNGNVIINWYSKKQLTLNFQVRDGPALKDKLIELVHKKPRKTTETQDANSPGPARGGSRIPIYPLFCPQDTNIPQNRKMCDTK